MAEKQASYIQASSHPADTDRLVLEALLNPSPAPVSGAAFGVGPTVGDLLVVQNGTPNMSVNVGSGHVWIDGTESATQGAYHGYNDATKNLVVAASDPTNPRKDLVVAKVQDAAYSGATNAWTLAVVTGTPAASPAEPAVPNNAVVLAMINVAALATTITNANITDRRRRACGLSGVAVCLSTTRPTTPYQGQEIFETDTNLLKVWSGAAWEDVVLTGAWATWTPTWTNLTVGNGTTIAKYQKTGRVVTFRIKFTLGSTSTVGTSPVYTLPVTAAADYIAEWPIGKAVLTDSGVKSYNGDVQIQTTTQGNVRYDDGAGSWSNVSATVPFTWGTGDYIQLSGFYESAS